MPRGQPDYGMYSALTYLASLADMAELAVRLNSIVIFDRRGHVIDLDDFEATVRKWWIGIPGGALIANAMLDNTNPKSGSQDMKLTVAAAPDIWVRVDRGFMPLASKRVGAEISFSGMNLNTYLTFSIHYYDGTWEYIGEIWVDFNGQRLLYLDNAGVYQLIANIDAFNTDFFVYYPIKLVVDLATHRYVRLNLGLTQYNLAGYDLRAVASVVAPQMITRVQLNWRAGVGGNLYVDDYIMTIDEP